MKISFICCKYVPFKINVEIVLLGIVLGVNNFPDTNWRANTIGNCKTTSSAEKRTMQHIWGQILFSNFTAESGTKVWRMIMRFCDAIKGRGIANIQHDQIII